MARKTDRNFLADFETLEIEYLPEKGPEVSSDIQMVYVMGNVAPAGAAAAAVQGSITELEARQTLVAAGFGVFIGAVAGNVVLVELEVVNAGGIIIDGVGCFVNDGVDRNAYFWTQGVANVIVGPVARAPGYEESPGAGAPVAAVGNLISGSLLNANVPANTSRFTTRVEGMQGLFVRSGQFIAVAMSSIALNATPSIRWRELAPP